MMKGLKYILLSFRLKWYKFLHVFEQLFVQNFQSGRIVMPQSDLRFPSSANKTKQNSELNWVVMYFIYDVSKYITTLSSVVGEG